MKHAGFRPRVLEGHGGDLAVSVAQAHRVSTLFTLSGAHVFPMYDGAVPAAPPMRILDVRHEATAVFAAEATAKLTRIPGLAVLTAGPGVTNGVSAIAQARFAGSPLVVIGGRAPTTRWGMGSLQELDHPPLVAPITKLAATVSQVGDISSMVDRAFTTATQPHRGPVFLDVPMDQLFSRPTKSADPQSDLSAPAERRRQAPDQDRLDQITALLRSSRHPVLVVGGDVWADGADDAAVQFIETTGIPVVTNGMGRGLVPRGHPQLVTKARSVAFGAADLVVVAGTPLDFRLGYGVFGGRDGAVPARIVHLADSPDQLATHVELAGSAAGDLTMVFDGLRSTLLTSTGPPEWSHWLGDAAGRGRSRRGTRPRAPDQ